MAYKPYIPDPRTIQRIQDTASDFTPSMSDLDMYQREASAKQQAALQAQFGAAQQSIGQQFTPAMRLAQARLGASPLLGDSGYANRLNRQLQQSAFGQLSNAYGQYAGQGASNLSQFYQNLLNSRMGAREGYIQNMLGGAYQGAAQNAQKKGVGDYAGALLGTAGGAFLGGYGTGLGNRAAK